MDNRTEKTSSKTSVSLIIGTVLFFISFIPLIFAIYKSFTGYFLLTWFFGFPAVLFVLLNEFKIFIPFICLLFQVLFFTSYIRKHQKLLKVSLCFIGIVLFSVICSSILSETNLNNLDRSAQARIRPHLAALYGEEAAADMTYYLTSKNSQSYEGHSPALPPDVSFQIQVIENREIRDDFTAVFQETNKSFSNEFVQYVINKHDLPSNMKYKISIVSIDFQDYKNGDDYKILFERTKYALCSVDVNFENITETEVMNLVNRVWKNVFPKVPVSEDTFDINIKINNNLDTYIRITNTPEKNSATAKIHVWSNSSSLSGLNKKKIELTR
ncbi:MAG: SUR7/PalI family protein [Saccharofermentans sp.]|nr:SUR7/PalI family protein [Saccharofermentans sp.]